MKIRHLSQNLHFRSFYVLLLLSFFSQGLILPVQNSFGEVDPKNQEEIHMIKGDLEAVKAYSLVRVSVSNPEIADIANADNDQVLMLAKKPGQCALFLWDEYGKRTIIIRVFSEDLELVKARVDDLLKRSEIKGVKTDVNAYEGKVVLTGNLPSKNLDELDALISPFENSVMNLVREEVILDLVQVDVQIAELNASYAKDIGVDWVDSVNIVEGLAGTGLISSTGEDIPFAEDSIFRVGKLRRITSIAAIINAAVTEGKGRILSKPKLVVISGKEASFLVGGEIPIRTTNTSAGGNVTENIEFKDFGISLTITPIIVGNNVDVTMSVEVSDIDETNAVGENVAFSTRTAQTQLFLEDGQSAVLAGLIKHAESETINKVPLLGDIPLLGALFRNRSTEKPNTETELVISLTPTIIRQRTTQAADATGTPTPSTTSTNENVKGEVTSTATSAKNTNPEAPATPAAAAKAAEDDYAPYVKSIQEKISGSISYPFEAKEKGWEGTVKLSLHLMKDGTLANLDVKESSGYSIFDKDALNTAQILAPYEAFPSNMKLEELIVTVPIVYSQKSFSNQNANNTKIEPISPSSKAFVPTGKTYAEWIQKKIADAAVYPQEAKEYGWEGTVKLALHILNDGTLAYATVKESSGYDLFDEAALKTAKTLAPYSGFPTDSNLQELNLTVPIVYSLEKK